MAGTLCIVFRNAFLFLYIDVLRFLLNCNLRINKGLSDLVTFQGTCRAAK
jgi:hypothetical protein